MLSTGFFGTGFVPVHVESASVPAVGMMVPGATVMFLVYVPAGAADSGVSHVLSCPLEVEGLTSAATDRLQPAAESVYTEAASASVKLTVPVIWLRLITGSAPAELYLQPGHEMIGVAV